MMIAQNWNEINACAHVDAAIAAGAYIPEGQKSPIAKKPSGRIDLINGVDDAEATLAGQALAARKEK